MELTGTFVAFYLTDRPFNLFWHELQKEFGLKWPGREVWGIINSSIVRVHVQQQYTDIGLFELVQFHTHTHSVHLNLHSRVLHHRAIYSYTLSAQKTNILHWVAGQEGNSRWVAIRWMWCCPHPGQALSQPLYCFDSRRALLPIDHALDGVRAHIWHQLEIDWWRL